MLAAGSPPPSRAKRKTPCDTTDSSIRPGGDLTPPLPRGCPSSPHPVGRCTVGQAYQRDPRAARSARLAAAAPARRAHGPATVLTVEPLGSDGHLLLLGESVPSGSLEPPRLKVRLAAADLAACQDAIGDALDPAALINRTVVLRLQTSLRQRYGRGLGFRPGSSP